MDLKALEAKLPPMIARSEVDRLLGGAISSKTLANHAAMGTGPESFRVGRKIVYDTRKLLSWLERRSRRM